MNQFLAGKRADGPQEALKILDIVLREASIKRYNALINDLNFLKTKWL